MYDEDEWKRVYAHAQHLSTSDKVKVCISILADYDVRMKSLPAGNLLSKALINLREISSKLHTQK